MPQSLPPTPSHPPSLRFAVLPTRFWSRFPLHFLPLFFQHRQDSHFFEEPVQCRNRTGSQGTFCKRACWRLKLERNPTQEPVGKSKNYPEANHFPVRSTWKHVKGKNSSSSTTTTTVTHIISECGPNSKPCGAAGWLNIRGLIKRKISRYMKGHSSSSWTKMPSSMHLLNFLCPLDGCRGGV